MLFEVKAANLRSNIEALGDFFPDRFFVSNFPKIEQSNRNLLCQYLLLVFSESFFLATKRKQKVMLSLLGILNYGHFHEFKLIHWKKINSFIGHFFKNILKV